MIGLAVLVMAAWADDGGPTCDPSQLPEPATSLSVAWVAPRGRRVGRRTWLTVVPTVDLMAFAKRENATVGRLLEHLGQRRSGRREPRRSYKVLVFDVTRDMLCRPLDAEPASMVGGVPVCELSDKHFRDTDRCGWLVDTRTRRRSLPALRAQWGDLVRAGFCVLPAERFVRP